MKIILIAALSADGFMARHEGDPLRWTEDKQLFRRQTMGYPVIMGSVTARLIGKTLDGREVITLHRDDDPEKILAEIQSKQCFIAGGSRTNSRFAPYLTHLYLTVHPVILGTGQPLFYRLKESFNLSFIKTVVVAPERGIIQFQYLIRRSG